MPDLKNPDERSDKKPEDQPKPTAGETPKGSDAGKKNEPEKPEEIKPVKIDIAGLGDNLSIEDAGFRVNRLISNLGQSEADRKQLMARIDALEKQISTPSSDDLTEKRKDWLLTPEEMDHVSTESAKKTAQILWNAQIRREAQERLNVGMKTEDEEMTSFVKELADQCGRQKLPDAVLHPKGIDSVYQNIPQGERVEVMKRMIRDAAAEHGLIRPNAEQLAVAEAKVKDKFKDNLPDGSGGPVEEVKGFDDLLGKMKDVMSDY